MSAKPQVTVGKNEVMSAQDAINYYERAVRDDPNNADKHLELGAAHYVAHQWEAAIPPLEKAVELNPRLGHAHYYLGVIYAAMGHYQRAQKELDAVLQVSDNPILKAQAKARIPAVRSFNDLGAN